MMFMLSILITMHTDVHYHVHSSGHIFNIAVGVRLKAKKSHDAKQYHNILFHSV